MKILIVLTLILTFYGNYTRCRNIANMVSKNRVVEFKNMVEGYLNE